MSAIEKPVNRFLRQVRPQAGLTVKGLGGTATFCAPEPQRLFAYPSIRPCSPEVVACTEAYLDLAAPTPEVTFGLKVTFWFCLILYVFMLLVGAYAGFQDMWLYAKGMFLGCLAFWALLSLGTFGLAWLEAYSASKCYVLRFHRQRQSVCYLPSNSTTPVIIPWREITAWIQKTRAHSPFSGMGSDHYRLYFAMPKADGHEQWHVFVLESDSVSVNELWNDVYCYMAFGPVYEVPSRPEAEASQVGRWWSLWQWGDGFEAWLSARWSMRSMPASLAEWSKTVAEDEWITPLPLGESAAGEAHKRSRKRRRKPKKKH